MTVTRGYEGPLFSVRMRKRIEEPFGWMTPTRPRRRYESKGNALL